ncbi:hypothetical protein [Streptomyces sp. NPDC090080]|uniref:hypothetical protein n=1 Tax=Streptomyces sp. NPDC090080 TaxID=3365939 RepID=UPI003817005E
MQDAVWTIPPVARPASRCSSITSPAGRPDRRAAGRPVLLELARLLPGRRQRGTRARRAVRTGERGLHGVALETQVRADRPLAYASDFAGVREGSGSYCGGVVRPGHSGAVVTSSASVGSDAQRLHERTMMRRTLATAAMTGLLLAFGTGVSGAATPTTSAIHKEVVSPDAGISIACSLPQGNYANFDYSNGITSTTIFYNNHCSSAIYVTVHDTGGNDCWLVPAGKSSKIYKPDVTGITAGC